jgi:hypothetical protein
MHSNEAVKFLGQYITNEYNENIGIVLGFICNGLGEVISFVASLGGEIHEIPVAHFEISESRLIYLSPITFSFKSIMKRFKDINLRISSLNRLNLDNEINKEVWEQFKLRVESSYKEIISEFNELKNKVSLRIQELKNKERILDETLIELKLNYIENNISKEIYDNSLRSILNAKQRIAQELKQLYSIQNYLPNIENKDVIEVKIIQ